MTSAKKDEPRNVEEFVNRKEELLALAANAGIDVTRELENVGGDSISQIGLLARLLGIDARVALNVSVSLANSLGSHPNPHPLHGSPEHENPSEA
jgi:hypothetical protein